MNSAAFSTPKFRTGKTVVAASLLLCALSAFAAEPTSLPSCSTPDKIAGWNAVGGYLSVRSNTLTPATTSCAIDSTGPGTVTVQFEYNTYGYVVGSGKGPTVDIGGKQVTVAPTVNKGQILNPNTDPDRGFFTYTGPFCSMTTLLQFSSGPVSANIQRGIGITNLKVTVTP